MSEFVIDRSVQKIIAMAIALVCIWIGSRMIYRRFLEKSDLSVEGKGIKAKLMNASPGLLISLFGIIIIITTVLQRETLFTRSTKAILPVPVDTTIIIEELNRIELATELQQRLLELQTIIIEPKKFEIRRYYPKIEIHEPIIVKYAQLATKIEYSYVKYPSVTTPVKINPLPIYQTAKLPHPVYVTKQELKRMGFIEQKFSQGDSLTTEDKKFLEKMIEKIGHEIIQGTGWTIETIKAIINNLQIEQEETQTNKYEVRPTK